MARASCIAHEKWWYDSRSSGPFFAYSGAAASISSRSVFCVSDSAWRGRSPSLDIDAVVGTEYGGRKVFPFNLNDVPRRDDLYEVADHRSEPGATLRAGKKAISGLEVESDCLEEAHGRE